ncbi:MAG: Hsp20/alpha crystallin family protein [Anaerolineae bacterium]|nr:Hsp20/alpha crystallin family protein [Anaerolineae bacterium]
MRNLIRWKPRSDVAVTDPFEAMDRMFDDMWRGWPGRFSPVEGPRALMRPAMDVVETESEWTVRVDLPGMAPDDVKIEIDDHTLTISGEVGDTIEQETDRYHCRERYYGAFQRSVRLPDTVDVDKVQATFDNGVLNLALPKLPQAQPKRIEVKAGK